MIARDPLGADNAGVLESVTRKLSPISFCAVVGVPVIAPGVDSESPYRGVPLKATTWAPFPRWLPDRGVHRPDLAAWQRTRCNHERPRRNRQRECYGLALHWPA